MRVVAGLAAGIALAAFVACSAQKQPATTPSPAVNAGAQPPLLPSDPKAQIKYYADEIEKQRQQLGMPEAVLPMSTQPIAPTPTAAKDPSCHPGAGEACSNVCMLSDSICENAQKICKIADDLGDDAWAADKCTSARSTCSDAHKRCCECS